MTASPPLGSGALAEEHQVIEQELKFLLDQAEEEHYALSFCADPVSAVPPPSHP